MDSAVQRNQVERPRKETLYDFCQRENRENVLAEWAVDRNGTLTPRDVTRGSHQKVWWRCGKGHTWRGTVYSRTSGKGCPYCANRRVLAGFNDLKTRYPEIAKQWDNEKNGNLSPDRVLYGTHQKVWWRCEKGHRWQAQIHSRTISSTGCPYCAGRKIRAGFNDLATLEPELAKEWHPEKNLPLIPQMISPSSHKKVWWKCSEGHEWGSSPNARTSTRSGCPVCQGNQVLEGENDFATFAPDLAAQWHPTKNGGIRPEAIRPLSNRSVWWLCPKGHFYKASVASRIQQGCGCPYCSGRKVLAGFNDLATTNPLIAAQWHSELNRGLTPEMVTKGSSKKVWWKCPDGHEWKAVVYSRAGVQNCGCPFCAGKYGGKNSERYRRILAEANELKQQIRGMEYGKRNNTGDSLPDLRL